MQFVHQRAFQPFKPISSPFSLDESRHEQAIVNQFCYQTSQPVWAFQRPISL
jgi:hypothetical protein